MNAKRTAALITLVAIIAVLSPMLVPDSEALKDGDISVRLENGADSIDISLEGGESKSTHVYVTNKTKSNVALNGMSVSGLGEDLSAVVTVSINDKVGSHVLSPAGKDGSFGPHRDHPCEQLRGHRDMARHADLQCHGPGR